MSKLTIDDLTYSAHLERDAMNTMAGGFGFIKSVFKGVKRASSGILNKAYMPFVVNRYLYKVVRGAFGKASYARIGNRRQR